MAKVNVKDVKEYVTKINNGWVEGAPDKEFSGVTQSEFATDIAAGAKAEQELADILAQGDMKRAEIEDIYRNLKAKGVRVANGVRGDKDYGPDSALYGAMGFVRDSERASGLTRKSKNTPIS